MEELGLIAMYVLHSSQEVIKRFGEFVAHWEKQ
jgi:hypothetical protein